MPPWPSIEPSAYDSRARTDVRRRRRCHAAGRHHGAQPVPRFLRRAAVRAKPRPGLTAHGEARSRRYELRLDGDSSPMRARISRSRGLAVRAADRAARSRPSRFAKRVENLVGLRSPDRLDAARDAGPAVSRARRDAVPRLRHAIESIRSRRSARMITWRRRPNSTGRIAPTRGRAAPPTCAVYRRGARRARYTAHLMDHAPAHGLLRGVFARARAGVRLRVEAEPIFPGWVSGKKTAAAQPPWNGKTMTRGMEFGVSPMPETRQAMIERGRPLRRPVLSPIPPALTSRSSTTPSCGGRANSRIPRLAGMIGFDTYSQTFTGD